MMKTMAGGSVANTIRGLSSGFGISSGIIGACGDDEQGQLFVNNMSSNGVDLSRLRKKKGHTAQVGILILILTPLFSYGHVSINTLIKPL
jgi:sugar/nucleoside kinase (ribokinase family)